MKRVQATRTVRRQSQAVSYVINAAPSVLTLGASEKVWTRPVEVSVTRLMGGTSTEPDCSLEWCTVADGTEGAWQGVDPSGTVIAVRVATTLQKVDEVRLRACLADGAVVATVSVPVVREGEKGDKGDPGTPGAPGTPGETGPQGAVLRVTEWAAGTHYNDGSVSEEGVRYIDVVTVREEGGGVSRFRCIQPHTSSAGIAGASNPMGCPESGVTANMHWSELSHTGPMYTPLLLAPNARIDFLGSQEVVIHESDGSVIGRLGAPAGQDEMTIMWTGGETLDDATYRLDCNGTSYWGEPGGNLVQLDPTAAQIVVWNGGERCTFIEANSYAGPVGVRNGDVVKGMVQTLPDPETGTGGLYTESTEVEVGSFRLMRAAKVRVSVPVSVRAHNQGVWKAKVSARIELRDPIGAVVHEFSEPVEVSGTMQADGWGDTATGYAEAWVDAGILRPVRHTVHFIVTVTHSGGSINAAPDSTASVELRRGLRVKVTDRTSGFEAHYYANGHYVGTGVEDYVMAWQDGDNGMAFEAVNGAGFGIGVDSTGVKVLHGAGWIPLPDYIRAVVSGEVK